MEQTIEYKGYTIEVWNDELGGLHEDFSDRLLIDISRYCNINNDRYKSKADLSRAFPGCRIVTVYAYVHSGVALNLKGYSCPWDSGVGGYLSIPKDAEEGWAEAVIQETNDILSGNIWGYSIFDSDGDLLESVGGYIGDPDDYFLSEAKSTIDYFKEKELNSLMNQVFNSPYKEYAI